MTLRNANVAVCETDAQAKRAILQPQRTGFDMAKLPLVGKQNKLEWNENLSDARMWSRANEDRIDRTFQRAFLAAHLLTGSIEQAESAILDAIERWDPDDADEVLFHQVLMAAVRKPIEYALFSFDRTASPEAALPAELEVVLRLSAPLRQAFVLRILVGLSRDDCAGMLRLSCARVDEFTCTALRCLAFFPQQPGAFIEQLS